MRIGFDGKRAVNNMTGLGNYSRLVIESMADSYPGSEMLVYVPELKKNPRLKGLEERHNVEFHLPPVAGFGGALWRSFGLTNNLAADKVSIYHGLSNKLPLNISAAGIPSVVTMHDVIYRRMPECYSGVDRILYDFKYGRSCRNATRIIAVSECTKRDVAELYGVDPGKIDVVYQGCDDSFRREIPEEELEGVRRRLGLPGRYVLQVGTIEERKNLELTVRGMASLPKDVCLLAVGRDRKGYMDKVKKIAAEAGVADRLIFRHDISFADLPAVNRLAAAVAYPSRYEGFGIPILEALESGRPVVAATGSCLEEAGGEGAVYVNPDDARGMGEALNAILTGSADVARMTGEGKRHASRFDTSGMASRIMAVYERAIANR